MERLIEALEKARHELVTLNGLIAFDTDDRSPENEIHIDTAELIQSIDAALADVDK